MRITKDSKDYSLDFDKALKSGAIKPIKVFNLEITEDEAAVLTFILDRVGGSPTGARGYTDEIRSKLYSLGDLRCDKKLATDSKVNRANSIYLV